MSKVDQKNLFIQGLKIPWWKPVKEHERVECRACSVMARATEGAGVGTGCGKGLPGTVPWGGQEQPHSEGALEPRPRGGCGTLPTAS